MEFVVRCLRVLKLSHNVSTSSPPQSSVLSHPAIHIYTFRPLSLPPSSSTCIPHAQDPLISRLHPRHNRPPLLHSLFLHQTPHPQQHSTPNIQTINQKTSHPHQSPRGWFHDRPRPRRRSLGFRCHIRNQRSSSKRQLPSRPHTPIPNRHRRLRLRYPLALEKCRRIQP